ncbi:MAG: radical SAM protein [Candidatus Schekmanbacteria bacterium]|nr:MAG: radical SAM protein [Candidatus Schekmanbacteria bacterium]
MRVLFFAVGQELLGIEYLSSALKKDGHEVELAFDPGLDNFLGFIDVGVLKKLSGDKWYLEKIKSFKPDLIGFSCLTNLYSFACEKARKIKEHFDIPIVIGGIHPTILPDYVMENGNFDILCIGEADEAFPELLRKMQKEEGYYDTKNFWFRKNGTIIKNDVRPLIQDLDSLPFADRELFYKYGCFTGTLYFISGRGCPFSCSYCCHHFLQKKYKGLGKYVRKRSVDNILSEIKPCLEKYKVKSLYSMDDLFTINTEWIKEFSEKYRKISDLPIYCHVRPGTLNREIAKALADANCTSVFYGIDSGSTYIRNNIMNRKIKDEDIISNAKLLKEYGIKITTSAIFCLPDETEEQMFETVEIMKKIKADYLYTYIYYPFPNTESFNYCVEKGLLDEETLEKVKNGEGSFHKKPLIKSKYADLAQVLKSIAPLYVKFPFLAPLVKFLIRKRLIKLSEIVFFLTAPFTYAHFGREKMKEFISLFRMALISKFKRRIV